MKLNKGGLRPLKIDLSYLSISDLEIVDSLLSSEYRRFKEDPKKQEAIRIELNKIRNYTGTFLL